MEQAIPVSPTESEMNQAYGVFAKMADYVVASSRFPRELEEFRAIHAQVVQERDSVKRELAELRERTEQAQNNVNGYQNELNILRDELQACKDRAGKLESDLLSAWVERDDAQRKAEQASDQVAELTYANNSLHDSMKYVTAERDDLASSVANFKRDSVTLAEYQAVVNERNAIQTKFTNLRAMLDQVCQSIQPEPDTSRQW